MEVKTQISNEIGRLRHLGNDFDPLLVLRSGPDKARFQSIDKVCLLCSHCDGADSLEHYSCCRFQWRSFSSICWHASLPCKLSRFLGLETDCINVKVWHACHMYAVKGAVDHRRRGNIVSGPEHVDALVRQGCGRACIHHKSLAKEFANIWAS